VILLNINKNSEMMETSSLALAATSCRILSPPSRISTTSIQVTINKMRQMPRKTKHKSSESHKTEPRGPTNLTATREGKKEIKLYTEHPFRHPRRWFVSLIKNKTKALMPHHLRHSPLDPRTTATAAMTTTSWQT